jgi:CubicO group peptidase (beta-lactamase class C family)
LFESAYGFASREFGIKNSLDTKFNLGSLNKLFTALAVTQLIQQGRISIDDRIGKYLDGFPGEIADNVTVRQLLQMRAGWGDYWGNDYFLAHRARLRQVSDYMEFIRGMPLDFEPGTDFQHCNTCFEILGAIVESASEMDYYEYVRKNIYIPAGMSDSGSFHRDGPAGGLATGYTNLNPNDEHGEGYRWTNTYMLPPRGTPAGGGYSTVRDFLKFDQAFRGFELLDREHTQFVISQFKGSPGDEFAASGMAVSMGGAAGIGALYGRDMKSGITILIFSNIDFTATVETFRELRKLLGLD